MTIDELRRQIDDLDEQIVALLNKRAACALEIGELKRVQHIEIYQPDREAQVLAHAREAGRRIGGPLTEEAMTRLFERIIDEARRLEAAASRARQASPLARADAER
jgi:chorismate mutase